MKKAVASVIAIASMLFGSTVPAFASYQPSGLLDVPMPDTTPILQGTDDGSVAVNNDLHQIQFDLDMITYAKYVATVPDSKTTPDQLKQMIQSALDDIQTMLQMLQSDLSKVDTSKLGATTLDNLNYMILGFDKSLLNGLTPLKTAGLVTSSNNDQEKSAEESSALKMVDKLYNIQQAAFAGEKPNVLKEIVKVDPEKALTDAAITSVTQTVFYDVLSGLPEPERTTFSSDFSSIFNPLNTPLQYRLATSKLIADVSQTVNKALDTASPVRISLVENSINSGLDLVSTSGDSSNTTNAAGITQISTSSGARSTDSTSDNNQPTGSSDTSTTNRQFDNTTQPNSVNDNNNNVQNVAVEVVDTGTSVPNVRVNGQDVVFVDAKPFINSDNRTMVPIRFIADKFNATTQWDENKQEAIITCNGQKVVLQIGSKVAYINNTPFQMDTEAVTKDGRTFVPLVLIGKAFNVPVEWNTGLSTSQVVAN